MLKLLSIIFLINLIQGLTLPDGSPSLYVPGQDNIELLDITNLKSSIYGSERAWFVEFYSHWCGACQRFASHWKDLALKTKPWHSKVIQVAAINCADPKNDPICQEFNIEYYPTLRLFPPYASWDKPSHDSTLIKSKDDLIPEMVDFVEKIEVVPKQWPMFKDYPSKRLDPLFIPNKNVKYGFLVIEAKNSLIGKQLILDFSNRMDSIIIRRVTEKSNRFLVQKLNVDTRKLPVVFLIENSKGPLKKYVKFSEADNFKPIDLDKGLDEKSKFKVMIEKFLADYVDGKAQVEEKIEIIEDVKDEEDKVLTKFQNKIYMQDLESSLNVILRSEISRSKILSNEKLNVVKQWVKTLAKYFPGRREVKNYLQNLDKKLSNLHSNELSASKWKQMVDGDQTRDSFLLDKTEWIRCQGSEPRYRGFPCSLWTLFHTLTVGQIEYENSKPKPFDDDFNVKEVFESIQSFVTNFFRCSECSKNFQNETYDYLEHLKQPHDAVIYLWTVHNRVNNRLVDDVTSDPAYPKIQFPSIEQCPHCYNGTKEFLEDEVFKFLITYYSSKNIESIGEVVKIDDPDVDVNDRDDALELPPVEANNLILKDETSSSNLFLVFIVFVALGSCLTYSSLKKGKYKLQKHIV